jgi:SAM-dependent methyltransferase
MTAERRPGTAQANGRLWGERARDWADIQEAMFRPAYVDVLDRLGVGTGCRLLDAGCGAGMAAALAAERGAAVSGIDASEPLLEIARARVPDGDFRQGDLKTLPFEDDGFDVVTGFNAFQFAGNPDVALAEARRVARPGGAVVVMTWGPPEGMEMAPVLGAFRDFLPPPPPGAPGPFALSDAMALRAFAAGAGLAPREVFDVDLTWRYPDMATAIRGVSASGAAAAARGAAGEDAVTAALAAAFAPFHRPDGSVQVGARYRCLIARA